MLLWFDVIPEQIIEHYDWHTRETFSCFTPLFRPGTSVKAAA
jgi:hypothetical protein